MFGYRSLGFGAFPNRGAASPTIESIRESRVYTWTDYQSHQTVINREATPMVRRRQHMMYDKEQAQAVIVVTLLMVPLKNYRQSSTSSLLLLWKVSKPLQHLLILIKLCEFSSGVNTKLKWCPQFYRVR